MIALQVVDLVILIEEGDSEDDHVVFEVHAQDQRVWACLGPKFLEGDLVDDIVDLDTQWSEELFVVAFENVVAT